MAIYNTPSDAANTAVRSFLTSVGEHYFGRSFKTGTGSGKAIWDQIRNDFGNVCAYCGSVESLQIEHLVMFNRSEYGLHHPGNIVPACRSCNKRCKDDSKCYVSWEAHLASVCGGASADQYSIRRAAIVSHQAKYGYPELTSQERHAIRVIAESLYENIKSETQKSLAMYRKLDQAFVKASDSDAPA